MWQRWALNAATPASSAARAIRIRTKQALALASMLTTNKGEKPVC